MSEASILDCDVFLLANQTLDAFPEGDDFEAFASYRNLKRTGKGGMGDVFVADDQNTGRRVALKFVRSAWKEPDLERRFHREVSSLAQLEHPFIARLYDSGVHPDGTPYFSMEYVEGKPLDEYCKESHSPPDERIRLFHSVCEAVSYAHSRALVHLDLKPSNILVKGDGTPKLLDFGIAKRLERADESASVTQTQVGFTPDFAAPEQILRRPVGTFTDVYSLGVILYELLTGRRPYDHSGRTPGEVEAWTKDGRDPEKPSIVARREGADLSAWNDLDVLCLTALKKDIQERYRSVVELTQDVEHYLKGEPLKAQPDSMTYRFGKFVRRNRRRIIVAAAVGVVILTLTGFYLVRLKKARDAVLAQAVRTQRVEEFMLTLFGSSDSGPPDDLRVITLVDTGVKNAALLNKEPSVQADLYNALGRIYQHLGKLDRAESLLRSSLELRRSAFGEQSDETANSLLFLGYLRVEQAQFREADRLMHQALAIYRQKYPSDHPAVGRALTALGSNLFHEGRMNDGIQALDEAARILSKSEADQDDLVESLTFLANCHQHLGHNSIANSLHWRILEIDRRIYGSSNPQVAEDLSNLAESSAGLGKYRDAEQYDREAVAIEERWYGKNHTETQVVSMGFGKTLVLEGKYDEGIRVLQIAVSILERNVGRVHPFISIASEWLGVAALKQGKLDQAQADFQRMAEVSASVFGTEVGHQGKVSLRYGELTLARKQYVKAEGLFREATQRFSTAFSPDNVYTAIARVHLGSALVAEKRYAEAEPELLAGYKIVTNEDNYRPADAIDARHNLVAAYEGLGALDKAAKFRRELAADGR